MATAKKKTAVYTFVPVSEAIKVAEHGAVSLGQQIDALIAYYGPKVSTDLCAKWLRWSELMDEIRAHCRDDMMAELQKEAQETAE